MRGTRWSVVVVGLGLALGSLAGPAGAKSPFCLDHGVAVTGGSTFSVALRSDGTVWTWGTNHDGELGNGTTVGPRPFPGQVSGLTGITAISAGAEHGLALRADGTVWSWGYNSDGQIGDGTTTDRPTPVHVWLPVPATAVAAGAYFSLALGDDGSVWAWGYNDENSLGVGTGPVDSHWPVQVGLPVITAIGAGADFGLAVDDTGQVWAWGRGFDGQIGDGLVVEQPYPVPVPGVTSAVAVAGGFGHSLALMSGGTVEAWGSNGNGQLGDGMTVDVPVAYTVAAVSDVVAVAAGPAGSPHSLALRGDGTVFVSGSNQYGQIGDGTYVQSPWPAPVLAGATAIGAGALTSYAVAGPDRQVYAWGYDADGETGDGTIIGTHPTPTPVGLGCSVVP